MPGFAAKLSLIPWTTNISAQKIDSLLLETYYIVSAGFLLQNNFGRVWFFEEVFLLANTSIKVVLRMFFLFLSNANFQFSARELIWRSYISAEILRTARQIKLIDKYKFAKVALDKNSEIFIVYISALKGTQPILPIYLFWAPLLAFL